MNFKQWIGGLALAVTTTHSYATTYDIEELPVSALSASQFGSSIDNTGLILSTLINPFNQPINADLFDVNDFPVLVDPNSAAAGDFNILDFTIVLGSWRENATNFSSIGPKLATTLAYQTDGVDTNYVFGFDQMLDATNGFTFAMNTTPVASSGGLYIIGNSPTFYSSFAFTDANGLEQTAVINEAVTRGFVQFSDRVFPLTPVDDTLGGISVASDINDNLQVAGTSSVDVLQIVQDALASCNEEIIAIPQALCLYNLTTDARVQSGFVQRATIWQLDARGQVVGTETFGLDFVPAPNDQNNYVNSAVAINNSGLAIGNGTTLLSDSRAVNAAMLYENGQTIRLIDDDSVLPNFAVDINEDDVVAGYQAVVENNASVARFFTFNVNTNELNFPVGFFASSSTFPRAINNDGVVVGDAEVNADQQGLRPRAGFVYNPDTDLLLNLNDLIPCDAEYNVFAANDINDDGVIVADASVLRSARNARGEIVLDANGNEVIETAVVAVRLTPNGGDIPDCSATEVEDGLSDERQGASNSLVLLFILSFIGILRRNKPAI